jgi:hypothetical protein
MQIDSMYNDFEGKVVLDLGTGTVRPCIHWLHLPQTASKLAVLAVPAAVVAAAAAPAVAAGAAGRLSGMRHAVPADSGF